MTLRNYTCASDTNQLYTHWMQFSFLLLSRWAELSSRCQRHRRHRRHNRNRRPYTCLRIPLSFTSATLSLVALCDDDMVRECDANRIQLNSIRRFSMRKTIGISGMDAGEWVWAGRHVCNSLYTSFRLVICVRLCVSWLLWEMCGIGIQKTSHDNKSVIDDNSRAKKNYRKMRDKQAIRIVDIGVNEVVKWFIS